MSPQQQLQILIKNNFDSVKDMHCVYMLYYKAPQKRQVAIVVSGKTFIGSMKLIMDDLSNYFNSQFIHRQKDNIYTDYYKHIYENPDGDFWIDFTYTGYSPYQLLKTAYIYLIGTEPGTTILNRNKMPKIPKSTQGHIQRGWINRGHYLNFRIWQKRYDQGLVFH